ncbi:MAG: CUAEP/CCAEP-tail radical SAM protein [Arenicellales bacterium]|nr:CUAEP/CCAEP-tail radical SAM protein [Arenicellales bacterium]
MKIVLVNPYEIGRQPFGLAEPAALLTKAGCTVRCIDLSIQKLDAKLLAEAQLVGIYIAMHTATRIAAELLPRIRGIAPRAHICTYGLYAPMNEDLLRRLGVNTVLGGEFESGLLSMVDRLRSDMSAVQTEPVVNLSKIPFLVPNRTTLPALSNYAHLILPDGFTKTVGFAEASRGCKHLCRHCPVVPVYDGKFRIVPRDVVVSDIRNQVHAGAEHISFGDPDFLNGPGHALKVVRALHREFPQVTYDVTIKIEHILQHQELLSELKDTGCLFITSAVESVDNQILEYLDKGHTREDFIAAVGILRNAGIALAPTFVAFTPWTTLHGYLDLLQQIVDLNLVESIPPVQLSIRLLVPKGSYLFKLPGFAERVQDFDPATLGYPWHHQDPRVDKLQQTIQACAASAELEGHSRSETFSEIWRLAHRAAGEPCLVLTRGHFGEKIPRMSEPWYCCAEPTRQQLGAF